MEAGQNMIDAVTSSATEGERDIVTRMIVAKLQPMVINTRNNIALAIFGEINSEKILDLLIYSKNSWTFRLKLFIGISWFTGIILILLALVFVVPSHYGVFGGILTLPGLMINFTLLIIDVCRMLIAKFDTWYMVCNIFGFYIGISLVLQDYRIIGLGMGVLIGYFWSLFADAMPAGFRRSSTIFGIGIGLFGLVFIQTSLYYDWIKAKPFDIHLGAIHYSGN